MTLGELRRMRGAADKRSHYKRRRADKRHFAPAWTRSHKGRVFTGGESITIEAQKLKYVASWSPYFPFTAGELARTYLDGVLKAHGEKRISAHFSMGDFDREALEIPAPLYFDPKRGREGKFVYVDIAACYFSLFACWPLNVGFNHRTGATGRPTPFLGIPERDRAWLEREKGIRHALFGMLGARYMFWYKDGRSVSKETLGRYGAPELNALVKLSCHSIAKTAVDEFDCRMWLTDAGIFPEREGLLFQVWLADKWRLSSKPKAYGNGHLFALGDYQIGHVRSQMGHVDLRGIQNLSKITLPPVDLAGRRRARLEGADGW